jgi:hypothetical protein
MDNKTKQQSDRSTSTIDIGKERKERIEDFRARQQLKGKKIERIDEAVNMLIDAGLEAETLEA